MQTQGQIFSSENNAASEKQQPQPMKQEVSYEQELTIQQATFLMKFLPLGYSLQNQTKTNKRGSALVANKPVRSTAAKKKITDNKMFFEGQEADLQLNRSTSVRSKKPVSIKYNEQIDRQTYGKYPGYVLPQTGRRASYEGLDESLKPCIKILTLLKNSKTSWPFREPVDAIGMGIPQYLQIIKEPMDLSKIQNNLRTNQYATPTQFHADINKIIRNSQLFNQGNPEFLRITQQFQEYYFKTLADPNTDSKTSATNQISRVPSQMKPATSSSSQNNKKKRPDRPYSSDNPISLNEKKQLSMNIRKLPRQHMKGIVDIVRQEGDNKIKDQFDLQDLLPSTIRQLQNYVRQKLNQGSNLNKASIVAGKIQQKQKNQESEFQIQSQQDS